MTEFFAGAAVMFVIGIIAAGVVFDQQSDKIKYWKAKCFKLTETVIDLEQRAHPLWEVRSDGVYQVIERGRPDLPPRREPTRPPGELLSLVDIDDIPEYER